MKPTHGSAARFVVVILLSLFITKKSSSQGRVVINEYMPWTSNTCGGPTSEFVELLNFGPGPVNIGCYILTDGDYSVTIPPNTIIQPGQFYVISGQDIIAAPCANIDSTIHTQLNWNTCNCTSAPIPTTGDGFFTDGGSASEQVVLLSPTLTVVDAVVRDLPVEPSALITTSSVGGCLPKIFDLDLMSINYETIGESAGRGNSFARKLDGDCGWVKDPQQSANATNNTPGDFSDVNYAFNILQAMSCHNDGSVSVTVSGSGAGSYFPMTYTLAFDTDSDGIFEISDSYINATASVPPTLTLTGLVAGKYRLTVGSSKGCNLKTFPFTILACFPALPVTITSFAAERKNEKVTCSWSIANADNINYMVIEHSTDGLQFSTVQTVQGNTVSFMEADNNDYFYRLKIVLTNGQQVVSYVVKVGNGNNSTMRIWPNPATRNILAQQYYTVQGTVTYYVLNAMGVAVVSGSKTVQPGQNTFDIPLLNNPPGVYQLVLTAPQKEGSARMQFIKQ